MCRLSHSRKHEGQGVGGTGVTAILDVLSDSDSEPFVSSKHDGQTAAFTGAAKGKCHLSDCSSEECASSALSQAAAAEAATGITEGSSIFPGQGPSMQPSNAERNWAVCTSAGDSMSGWEMVRGSDINGTEDRPHCSAGRDCCGQGAASISGQDLTPSSAPVPSSSSQYHWMQPHAFDQHMQRGSKVAPVPAAARAADPAASSGGTDQSQDMAAVSMSADGADAFGGSSKASASMPAGAGLTVLSNEAATSEASTADAQPQAISSMESG